MTQRERLEQILDNLWSNREVLLDFILWCHDRNTKVSPVAFNLWERECRDLGKWA